MGFSFSFTELFWIFEVIGGSGGGGMLMIQVKVFLASKLQPISRNSQNSITVLEFTSSSWIIYIVNPIPGGLFEPRFWVGGGAKLPPYLSFCLRTARGMKLCNTIFNIIGFE